MPTWVAVALGFVGGGVLLVVLLVLFLRFVVPRMAGKAFQKMATGMFEMKASALKGAQLAVARVDLAKEPDWAREEEADEETTFVRKPGRWVRLEARVTSVPVEERAEGSFAHWEPAELSAIPELEPGVMPDLERLADLGLDCRVQSKAITLLPGEAEGEDDEVGKILGPADIVMTVYVPDTVERLQLHYYSEMLGGPVEAPRVVEADVV